MINMFAHEPGRATSEVINFRAMHAAHSAAARLGDFRAGQISFPALIISLIAPLNTELCEEPD